MIKIFTERGEDRNIYTSFYFIPTLSLPRNTSSLSFFSLSLFYSFRAYIKNTKNSNVDPPPTQRNPYLYLSLTILISFPFSVGYKHIPFVESFSIMIFWHASAKCGCELYKFPKNARVPPASARSFGNAKE